MEKDSGGAVENLSLLKKLSRVGLTNQHLHENMEAEAMEISGEGAHKADGASGITGTAGWPVVLEQNEEEKRTRGQVLRGLVRTLLFTQNKKETTECFCAKE